MLPCLRASMLPRDGETDFGRCRLRLLIPNLITLLAMCLGLTAIRFRLRRVARMGRQAPLPRPAVLDGLDGRVARALKGTSRFGAELDSLADFVDFGVAPGIVALSLRPGSHERARMAGGAAVFHCLRLEAGALQRDDRRSRHAGLAQEFLRRHAGAGRSGRRLVARLFEPAQRPQLRRQRRPFSASRPSMCSGSPC